MKNRFFDLTSSEDKKAYIPASRLLRIATFPREGIVTLFFEDFQADIQATKDAEAEVAKSLYEYVTADLEDHIRLSPKSSNVLAIHF